VILRYDGVRWYRQASPVDADLRAVWGTGPTDVYAVGEEGVLLRWDGVAWVRIDSPVEDYLLGLSGDGTDALAVGMRRVVLRGLR
jgi:hypothetical protein